MFEVIKFIAVLFMGIVLLGYVYYLCEIAAPENKSRKKKIRYKRFPPNGNSRSIA